MLAINKDWQALHHPSSWNGGSGRSFTVKWLKAAAEPFLGMAPSVGLVRCHFSSQAETGGSTPPQLHAKKKGRLR